MGGGGLTTAGGRPPALGSPGAWSSRPHLRWGRLRHAPSTPHHPPPRQHLRQHLGLAPPGPLRPPEPHPRPQPLGRPRRRLQSQPQTGAPTPQRSQAQTPRRTLPQSWGGTRCPTRSGSWGWSRGGSCGSARSQDHPGSPHGHPGAAGGPEGVHCWRWVQGLLVDRGAGACGAGREGVGGHVRDAQGVVV